MDKAEHAAKRFLDSTGLGTFLHEPDGNVPPDFALEDRSVGVEVRRLNQQIECADGRYRGLEDAAVPFRRTSGRFCEASGRHAVDAVGG